MFGHLAREEDKKASGERIEGAGVTDFDFVVELFAEVAADFGNYAKARNAGGFIY